jgi:2-hydroxy-3-keto-5-methylthiopentenyl-1-phosphate phosphatase
MNNRKPSKELQEFRSILKKNEDLLTSIRFALSKHEKLIAEVRKEQSSFKEFLDRILKSHHNLDETVCNVLLAIRQNEYLQAYYPAQHGYNEMKVTGKHPVKK